MEQQKRRPFFDVFFDHNLPETQTPTQPSFLANLNQTEPTSKPPDLTICPRNAGPAAQVAKAAQASAAAHAAAAAAQQERQGGERTRPAGGLFTLKNISN